MSSSTRLTRCCGRSHRRSPGSMGTRPWFQAELDRRLALNTMRRGDFEDALAAADAASDFVARHHLAAYDETHRFVRGWVALERGDYETAGPLLAPRVGDDDVVYPALGALLCGDVATSTSLLEGLRLAVEPDAPARSIEAELEPHLIASHAFEAAGDRARARAEADREVAIRRAYGPRFRLALALRRQASFLSSSQSVALLEEAVTLAESTPRRRDPGESAPELRGGAPAIWLPSAGAAGALRRDRRCLGHGHDTSARQGPRRARPSGRSPAARPSDRALLADSRSARRGRPGCWG